MFVLKFVRILGNGLEDGPGVLFDPVLYELCLFLSPRIRLMIDKRHLIVRYRFFKTGINNHNHRSELKSVNCGDVFV